jgi:cell wall-associated NlpC family hydrolase
LTSLFLRGLLLAAITTLLAAPSAALAARAHTNANGNGGAAYVLHAPTRHAPPRDVAGALAKLDRRGLAHPPKSAPPAVKAAIRAGNRIQGKPYVWGGGHGSWRASGYDCSGTVSYVLHSAGLLGTPLVSGALARWGEGGRGRWITIYANGGHTFVYLAGLRLEANGAGRGPRWHRGPRYSMSGYAVRHPQGL